MSNCKTSNRLRWGWAALLGLFAWSVTAQQLRSAPSAVEIRRTSDGIPHVKANDWRSLGIGVGYAQAEDALCTLSEAFVTYEGRRSWFFGTDARPARDSTFGRPANLDLDFFFRAFADAEVLSQYRSQQPAELNTLIEGFAVGYNMYLAKVRRRPGESVHRPCAGQAWLRDISADDVYRRMYAAQVAGGYAHFLAELVAAAPPQAQPVAASSAQATLAARLRQRIGTREGVGSNALAFGQQATGEAQAVLFGNPHWYWGGPDRFYQMHLTIPGQVNVAGVAFLGVPVVMMGFNDHVAWTHTVSSARRFGLFDLTLDGADPMQLRVGEQMEAMQARPVTVEVRGDDDQPQQVRRTLYRTRFGPIVNLGGKHPAFGWGREHALALRDVNAQNFRIFSNFFYWNQAKSLDDFIAIQRREAAVPWVNTIAIGRDDGRVWYGDVGAVPNVPDDQRARCTTPLAQVFAQVDAAVPVLDGSRADCDWAIDAEAVQPGAMPAQALPSLLRQDYVTNMNDSYWLTQPRQPLEGFPAGLGGERKALSLRGRMGHQIALELASEPSASAQAMAAKLRTAVLVPRAYSTERFKEELLAQACTDDVVDVAPKDDEAEKHAVRKVPISAACAALRHWTGRADPDARGALLWESFWTELESLSGGSFFSVPFTASDPLNTPSAPRTEPGAAAQALARAVLTLQSRHQRVDAPLRRDRFVPTAQGRAAIYGGCSETGYFAVACVDDERDGGVPLGPDTLANSYLQVVTFSAAGVQAHTLLAHGQDERALSGGAGAQPVVRYARKDWLRFPFTEADIARDPGLRRQSLAP